MRDARIVAETDDFAVVFKPPRMHCAPNKHNNGDTLLDWYAAIFPHVMNLTGKKKGEGGLLHRLDYETHGLVLFAKNQHSLDNLLEQQDAGNFIKEYSAVCIKSGIGDQGSGIRDRSLINNGTSGLSPGCSNTNPRSPVPDPRSPIPIESYFRPFGPGRKQVRAVTELNSKGKETATDKGGYYRTEIVSMEKLDDYPENSYHLTLRLKRGFRHQIRCHLAWIGCPVLNDPLYGSAPCEGFLALRAHGLFFTDPKSSIPAECIIEPLPAEGFCFIL